MDGYSLVVSFPDQSHSFCYGFEAGKIWQDLIRGDVAEISATTHVENREVLKRIAISQGWEVDVKPTDVEGWDYTIFHKTKSVSDKPNPHGLRIV